MCAEPMASASDDLPAVAETNRRQTRFAGQGDLGRARCNTVTNMNRRAALLMRRQECKQTNDSGNSSLATVTLSRLVHSLWILLMKLFNTVILNVMLLRTEQKVLQSQKGLSHCNLEIPLLKNGLQPSAASSNVLFCLPNISNPKIFNWLSFKTKRSSKILYLRTWNNQIFCLTAQKNY